VPAPVLGVRQELSGRYPSEFSNPISNPHSFHVTDKHYLLEQVF
jgi:hypothetical protein